ncbi:OLC1v1027038C1 [Oldenlandia corymbosa var. corymbosa]|uniref:hydroxyacylglutathione hydrolase n=1 Tax=Oldenlandia corymbosa var. corymbosa TaxID=529605 RepID=A0AAV1CBJ4_OLDCO|nr:OLC1v1027038C1 [Oldenlandia corymbosa var. corymbosa]
MKIIPIPCLEDNYSYLIVDEVSREGAVVDPVEPQKVVDVAEENWVDLKSVLTTHHHWDHAGGNEEMKKLVPKIKIHGGIYDNVAACTHPVRDGDKLLIGVDTFVTCLLTPCHTRGHISYYATGKQGEEPAVFTGDTMFVAGCGKFMEGTAVQMHESLCNILGALPKSTRVYCGHEYTVKNLQFASEIEPENSRIIEKLKWAKHQRSAGRPTVPSTIKEEWETNPFLRVDNPEIQKKVGTESPVEALQELRQRKDNWKA